MQIKNTVKLFATAALVAGLAGTSANADTVNPGFDLTQYGNPVQLAGPGPFDTYVSGVGAGVVTQGNKDFIIGGPVVNDPPDIDLLGWALAPAKGNPDTGLNGVGGGNGLNIFASWGGQQRVIGSTTDTVAAGATYTITAEIDGVAGGPMEGPLAFDLMANGIVLTPDAALPAFVATPGTFQTITRTYSNVVLPGGVSDGDALTILVGVQDSNVLDNRMIWDDVHLVPEPTSLALLGLGGLLIARRRRA